MSEKKGRKEVVDIKERMEVMRKEMEKKDIEMVRKVILEVID